MARDELRRDLLRAAPRRHAGLLLLLAAYLGLAGWMAFRLPAFSGPNEELHYEHVALLRRDLRLPDAAGSTRMDERHQPPVYYLAAALAGWRHADPPLDTDFAGNPHYLGTPRGNLNPKVGADPARAPLLYAARLTSLAFGLLGVLATWWAASLIAPGGPALLTAALLAFHPAYLHLSATAANDLPVAALSALALAWASRLLLEARASALGPGTATASPIAFGASAAPAEGRIAPGPPHPQPWPYRDPRDPADLGGLLWGMVFALALLTKANAIFLAVAWGALCLWLCRWRGLAAALRAGLAALAGFLPLVLAWTALNQARGLDATGVERSVPVGRLLTLRPEDLAGLGPRLPQIWRSVWLDWSRGDVGHAPDGVYVAIVLLLLAAAAGWLLRARGPQRSAAKPTRSTGADRDRGERTDSLPGQGAPADPRASDSALLPLATMHLAWLLAFGAFYLAVKALMLAETGLLTAEGRWILPLAPSLAWLTGFGLVGLWPPGRRDRAARAFALVVALSGIALALWLVPALYPRARALDPAAARLEPARGAGIVHGATVELEAIEGGDELAVGRRSALQLVWRVLEAPAEDDTISSQLLAPDGAGGWRKLDQHDSYPGLGSARTSDWRGGQRWSDPITLQPATGAEDGPIRARLGVWLVPRAGAGSPLPATRDGQPVGVLDMPAITLRPASPLEVPASLAIDEPARFGEAIELAGWSVAPEADGAAGEAGLALTLYWRARTELDADYTVFAQLVDDEGTLLDQADGDPLDGASPTSIWRAGDVIRDPRRLAAAPESGASLLLGFYDRASGRRLEAWRSGARLPDDALRLPLR